MKIQCTEKEKELLIDVFMGSCICPFKSAHCSEGNVCRACLEKNIKWQIKGGWQK